MAKGISKQLLHEDYNKTGVAVRYYEKTEPGRFPNTLEGRRAAQKQFQQDTKLDPAVLLEITTDIQRQQLDMLKTYAQIKLIAMRKII